LEDPDTGVAEQRLYHFDRIMFGTNTILVFKYPLMKRKLNAIKAKLKEEQTDLSEQELEAMARRQMENLDSIVKGAESDQEQEEESKQSSLKVEDYTKEEMDEDTNTVDWDTAYNEVLAVEEKKKDQITNKKLQE